LAKSKDPVVQAELRLIKSKTMKRDKIHNRVIPLLREGTARTAFPPLLGEDKVFADFRNEKDFFASLFELVLTLHRIPLEDTVARRHRDELNGISEMGPRLGGAKGRAGQGRRRSSSI